MRTKRDLDRDDYLQAQGEGEEKMVATGVISWGWRLGPGNEGIREPYGSRWKEPAGQPRPILDFSPRSCYTLSVFSVGISVDWI